MGFPYLNLLASRSLKYNYVEDLSALEEISALCVLVATGDSGDKISALDLLRTYNPLFEVGIKRKALAVEVYLSVDPLECGWDFVASVPENLFVGEYNERSA